MNNEDDITAFDFFNEVLDIWSRESAWAQEAD